MRKQCPECSSVTGGLAVFCGSCGFQFRAIEDPVRAVAARPKAKKHYGAAALIGVFAAVIQYMIFR